MQEFNRFIIRNTREWRYDAFEFGYITTDGFQFCTAVFHHGLNDMSDKFLLYTQTFLVIYKCHFRLNHPELDQVATCFGLLCAECWTK
ncbi:hypothetical protein D3C76_1757660 [compost metagenome]